MQELEDIRAFVSGNRDAQTAIFECDATEPMKRKLRDPAAEVAMTNVGHVACPLVAHTRVIPLQQEPASDRPRYSGSSRWLRQSPAYLGRRRAKRAAESRQLPKPPFAFPETSASGTRALPSFALRSASC